MKANNLTISTPYRGCDKDCSYCVSKMTGYLHGNGLYWKNMNKVVKIADTAGVTSILVTSKGETLMAMSEVQIIATKFSDWPLELQTNGLKLLGDNDLVEL